MNNVDRLFGENICTEYHVIICILMLLSLFIHIFNAFFFLEEERICIYPI